MENLIGRTVGKYKIVEQLGQGGMAEVYKAYQSSLDRYVALKVMHPHLAQDSGFRERFEREAKNVAALQHPNIVQVYDFDVEDGLSYMVMEFIDGLTLKTRLEELHARNQRLPLAEAIRILRDVSSALAYAHERGMAHRDIKPANVMVDRSGRVFLTDFGIAKILAGPQHTASGVMMGTPAYMSPEQGLGRPGDERSDIYSLGIMLYELVTGGLPYTADTPVAIVLKHINEPLPAPRAITADLPESLEAIILRAAAKDPAKRYPSARAFVADLDAWQASQLPPMPPKPLAVAPDTLTATLMSAPPVPQAAVSTQPLPRRTRSRFGWGVGAAVVFAIAAGGGLMIPRLLDRNPGALAAATATATPPPTASATGVRARPTAAPSLTPVPNTPRPTPEPTAEPTEFTGHAESDPGGGAYCSSGAPHADLPPFADPLAVDISAETSGQLEVSVTLADPSGVSAVPDERAFYSLSVFGAPEGMPADQLSLTEMIFFNGLRFDASYDLYPDQPGATALALWSPEDTAFVPGPQAVGVEVGEGSSLTFRIDVAQMLAADDALADSVRDGLLSLRVAVLAQFWTSSLTSDSWCKAIGWTPDGGPGLPVTVAVP